MTEHDAPPPGTWPCRLYAERRLGSGPALATAARAIAEQLPSLLGTQAYDWDVESEPSRKVTLDDATMQRLLGRLQRGRPFLLADRASDWTALFAIGIDQVHRRDYADLALPNAGQKQLLGLEPMMKLVTAFAQTFGAYVAFVEDSALARAYSGRRAHERNYANLPADIRDLVPYEEFHELPGMAGSLPQLLHSSELPSDEIPSAVYWINWWSAPMIDRLGRSRVAQAGWARVEDNPDGSMTLAATVSPPDLTRGADIDTLASIVRALDLEAAQRNLA